jgi:predicted nucleic acid-binding protein
VRTVFADTGAFYALADRRDPAHPRAKAFHDSCEARYVTTDFVFAETMSLLTKRLGKAVAVRFGGALLASPRLQVAVPSKDVRDEAWLLFVGQADKDWDLIDCTSFALMERLGVGEAFGFDRHFLQRGLRLLPE